MPVSRRSATMPRITCGCSTRWGSSGSTCGRVDGRAARGGICRARSGPVDRMVLVSPAGLAADDVAMPDFAGLTHADMPALLVHDPAFLAPFWPAEPSPEWQALRMREAVAAARLREDPRGDRRTPARAARRADRAGAAAVGRRRPHPADAAAPRMEARAAACRDGGDRPAGICCSTSRRRRAGGRWNSCSAARLTHRREPTEHDGDGPRRRPRADAAGEAEFAARDQRRAGVEAERPPPAQVIGEGRLEAPAGADVGPQIPVSARAWRASPPRVPPRGGYASCPPFGRFMVMRSSARHRS